MEFISKAKNPNICENGIKISIGHFKKGSVVKEKANFLFLEHVAQIISERGYIQIAIDGDRMYFKDTSQSIGFKLVGRESGNRYCYITDKRIINYVREHEGDYEVKFDEKYKLYFIEPPKLQGWIYRV